MNQFERLPSLNSTSLRCNILLLQFTMNTFAIFCLLNIVVGNVRETDETCGAQETCLKREGCPLFQGKHTRLTSLKNVSSVEYTNLKGELLRSVCNKKERAVCCKVENPCEPFNICIARSECEYADDRIEQYKEMKRQNRGKFAKKIIEELKGCICNAVQRLMCCPTNPAQELDYLPTLGSCGTSTLPVSKVITQHAQFIISLAV